MRIIGGGKNKGRKIIPPVDRQTRPLRDIVKESIFNLIEHSNIFKTDINNSKILDLFSGSGSFGLECISRGARHVLFVEHYKEILNVLKKNIINFIDRRNEQSLGELFSFFILETILLGKALNINPFDQPAVELIKTFFFYFIF